MFSIKVHLFPNLSFSLKRIHLLLKYLGQKTLDLVESSTLYAQLHLKMLLDRVLRSLGLQLLMTFTQELACVQRDQAAVHRLPKNQIQWHLSQL